MAKGTEITENVERINTLIEQLQSGEHSKPTGEELFQEGQERLTRLRKLVDDVHDEIIELD
jgi:exodeoxyribonuclease VII small subunit